MDSNGTRFALLLGRGDWAQRCVVAPGGEPLAEAFGAALHGREPAVSWDARRHELILGQRLSVFPSAPANRPPQPSQRRGAAVDALGEIFWIGDDEREILVARPGDEPTRYWPPCAPGAACQAPRSGSFNPAAAGAPLPLVTLRGLAILSGGYLVVGAVELHGLLVFDLRTGGPPRQLLWPREVEFEAFDLAATAGGGVVVLDRRHARVWQLNASFEVVAPWLESLAAAPLFHAAEGDQAAAAAQAVTAEHGFATAAGAAAIETLANGSILVLVTPDGAVASSVRRYRDGLVCDEFSTAVAAVLIDAERRPGFSFLAHDFATVERGEEQVLYVVGAGGDQALVFRLTFEDEHMAVEPLPELIALRLFGGRGLAAAGGAAYYDFGTRWLPLVTQPRGRYRRRATVRVVRLDGRETDCVWHRLFLDACIPADCEVLVSTRTANDAVLLGVAPLLAEPQLLRRPGGSEVPWLAHGAGLDTWELLFQSARGRYLQIELTLTGTGRTTPRIHALRAYFPRFSYLERYLPAVYREAADSASFMERFLALFEGFYTGIEDRIAAAQTLLDARGAPAEALEWLGGWLAVAFDDSWSVPKRRLFLEHAMEFFEWRGTRRGLLAALRLALEECPDPAIFDFVAGPPAGTARGGIRIEETFRRRSPAGRPSIAAGAAYAAAAAAGRPAGPPVVSSAAWTGHLKRRFGSASALNEMYQTSFANLDEAAPSAEVLAGELGLFRERVLPVQEAAHQFAVFLPLPPGSLDGPRRIDIARRVLELEKPAHTKFTVDTYWTWFRLGEARLGEDTVLDLGHRSPSLAAPYVIGQTRVGAGYLAADAARIGPGRTVLARSCRRQPSLSSGEMR